MHFRRFRCKKKGSEVQLPAEDGGDAQSQGTSPQAPVEKLPTTHPAPAPEQPGQALSAPSPQSLQPNGTSKDVVQVSDSKCQDVVAHPDVPEMDPVLMALWARIRERVQELAAREKKTINENLQLTDVIEDIEKKEPRKRDRVKKVFGNTLTVIGRVGGIVADAASQVNLVSSGTCLCFALSHRR
jgi:hypothetical protein